MRTLYSIAVISLISLITACGGSSGGDNTSPDPEFATETYPDQDSFSLSVEKFNTDGGDLDGITSEITIRVADNLGNRTVLDDTEVYFSTEGGSIDQFCTIKDGACTVTWTSQAPRPSDGRSTVLAWTTGTESFTDLNSSGFFDDGDAFDTTNDDISEPYRDDNENGIRDANEEFIDFDGDNTFDAADGLYSGVNCAHATLCAPSQFLYIHSQTTIVMGTPSSGIVYTVCADALCATEIPGTVNLGAGGGTFYVWIRDTNNNPLPAGTTLEATSTAGGTATISPGTYPDTPYSRTFAISLVPTAVGTVEITVTIPDYGDEVIIIGVSNNT